MKIIHANKTIGTITSPTQDGTWMSGDICLEPSLESGYQEFFAFMVDESQGHIEPPFAPQLLNEENWSIEDNGVRRGISVPAIYSDGLIMWRWR